MKQNTTAFAFAVAVGALCAFSPRPAAAAPQQTAYSSTDADKKPLPQGPALESEYRLGPGDKLRIEVYKDTQLSQSVQDPSRRKDHPAARRRRGGERADTD